MGRQPRAGRGRRVGHLVAGAVLPLVLAAPRAAAQSVAAQTVAGRAVDRVSRIAVRDVAVEVLGERDSVVSLSRTNNAGEFYVDVPSPGTFHLRFLIDSLETFDSAPIAVRAGEFVQHLFVIDIRHVFFEFQVEKQVQMAPGARPPRYPDELRRLNIEGEVVAQFVVDTTGLALPETFKPIRFNDPAFIQAVRSALPGFRFFPAEIGGHKVKQLVQQPFTFGLSGGPGQPAPDPFGWAPRRGAVDPLARPWP